MTTDSRAHSSTSLAESGFPEDYDTILAAVSETPRGRWFLNEYQRRNRTADTTLVLKEIGRLEQLLALQHPQVAANRGHTALQELATVLAMSPDGRLLDHADGLTPEVIANLALAIGQSGEAIRESALTARGAAVALRDHQLDPARAARFHDALVRHLLAMDSHAGHVLQSAQRVEALSQVIAQIRERLRILLQSHLPARNQAETEPALRHAASLPYHAEMQTAVMADDKIATPPQESEPAPLPAFEQVWHVPPAPSHAKLRHVAALMQENSDNHESDAEALLDDNPLVALAQSARTAHAGRTLAELDRLSYSERAALFA